MRSSLNYYLKSYDTKSQLLQKNLYTFSIYLSLSLAVIYYFIYPYLYIRIEHFDYINVNKEHFWF